MGAISWATQQASTNLRAASSQGMRWAALPA